MLLETLILFGIVLIVGIVIGSFLNVCIYRIPKKESIVAVSSHCLHCEKKIKWFDLIPVFSFLFLRGRFRFCDTKLSHQYPIVELMNGIFYLIIFSMKGENIESVLYCMLISALIVLSVIDYRTLEIPVSVNAFIGVIGIILTVIDIQHYMSHLIGFFVVSLFLLLCFLITRGKGIGGGDIKLMAVAGLCIGGINIVIALIVGCFIGSIIESVKMGVTKKRGVFAFGPYLSVGIFLAILWGDCFLAWYVSLLPR